MLRWSVAGLSAWGDAGKVASQLFWSADHSRSAPSGPWPRTVEEDAVRQASGRFMAISELSASGGAYSSPPSNPAPEWKASTIAHTASSGSQAWKKLNPAVMVAARKTAAQANSTTNRHRKRTTQTALAKKMPIGASSTTSKRHGNCRNRSLGNASQTGIEIRSEEHTSELQSP